MNDTTTASTTGVKRARDTRLFCPRPPPTGVHAVSPHEAFNLFTYESILVLDASSEAGPALPGSAWCDAALPPTAAVAAARQLIMDEMTPDNTRTALLLHDDRDGDGEGRAAQVSRWLLAEHCSRVYTVRRAALVETHGFLFVSAFASLPSYPNEIVPGQLYLGSAACANEQAIADLRITHVVSVVERRFVAPASERLLCQIPDEDSADLTPVLRRALPFIERALAGGGRVLVHCERGASRSVSVVCAHLMRASRGTLALADALDTVRAQRPCAQPNAGFVAQLEEVDVVALDVLKSLPAALDEPYLFLSAEQASRCAEHPYSAVLAPYAPHLPGWVPQRKIAEALGYTTDGMQKARASLGGQPYVWATEFENVHSFWRFAEPTLRIDGVVYSCSEEYYHAQKPVPFDKAAWDAQRVDVMRLALRAKVSASEEVRQLLLATGDHPLLSIKPDRFWGFDPKGGGENMLARLLEELRQELRLNVAVGGCGST